MCLPCTFHASHIRLILCHNTFCHTLKVPVNNAIKDNFDTGFQEDKATGGSYVVPTFFKKYLYLKILTLQRSFREIHLIPTLLIRGLILELAKIISLSKVLASEENKDELPRSTPEKRDVSSKSIMAFLDDIKAAEIELHHVMFQRHGLVLFSCLK